MDHSFQFKMCACSHLTIHNDDMDMDTVLKHKLVAVHNLYVYLYKEHN